MKQRFAGVARDLSTNEEKILEEIATAEGKPIDIGGYYLPDFKLVSAGMRPSATFNAIIDAL